MPRKPNTYISVKHPDEPLKSESGNNLVYKLKLVDQEQRLQSIECTPEVYRKVIHPKYKRSFTFNHDAEFRTTVDHRGVITDITPISKDAKSSDAIPDHDAHVAIDASGHVTIVNYPDASPDSIKSLQEWFEENKDRRLTSSMQVGALRIKEVRDTDGTAEVYLTFV